MKNTILATVLAVSALASHGLAFAGSDTKTFNVKVELMSACKLSSITDVDFGTYTSLQQTPKSATGGDLTVTCTNNTPYYLMFGSAIGGMTSSGTVPSTDLIYTLGLSRGNGTGDGTAQAVAITGSMPANQPGSCAFGICAGTDATQVLYVTY